MTHDRSMTLHFNDGTKLSFEFAEQAPNSAAKQIKLAEFLTSKHVVIEAEGSVMIFPVANIKYIALNAPTAMPGRHPVMPKHAILGARLIG
jgi:hypothetical protein